MGVDYGDVVQYPPSTEELDTMFKVRLNVSRPNGRTTGRTGEVADGI